jgi:hypothetical protein
MIGGKTVRKGARQKAWDVFDNTQFAFATKGKFSEAFPTIAEAGIVVEETDFGEPLRTHHYSTKVGGIGEFVNCSNSMCYNGGVNVAEVLRHMVREGLTEYETQRHPCQGYEGSPKGRKKYRTCGHGFKVTAKITYKAPPIPTGSQDRADEKPT